ncbi:hypothetical protein PG997_004663 [Apiospora hydei]|uniref:Uncharacterized protein n=1 Tax=Apiospora hydei TaxID=1337664 RepID=A0ABR1X2X4_9PEZI
MNVSFDQLSGGDRAQVAYSLPPISPLTGSPLGLVVVTSLLLTGVTLFVALRVLARIMTRGAEHQGGEYMGLRRHAGGVWFREQLGLLYTVMGHCDDPHGSDQGSRLVPQLWFIFAFSAGVFVWELADDIATCDPIAATWNPALGTCSIDAFLAGSSGMFVSSTISFALDISCVVIAWRLLQDFDFLKQARWALGVLFVFAIYASIAPLARFHSFDAYAGPHESLYKLDDIMIWSNTEAGVALIVISVPSLARISMGYFGERNGGLVRKHRRGAPVTNTGSPIQDTIEFYQSDRLFVGDAANAQIPLLRPTAARQRKQAVAMRQSRGRIKQEAIRWLLPKRSWELQSYHRLETTKKADCCKPGARANDCIDRIALRECEDIREYNKPLQQICGWMMRDETGPRLGILQGITNLKASLVMSRAEFDYDSRIISAAELTQQLERKTGFLCEEISTKGASLDVLPTGDVKAFTQQALPLGVTAMKVVDKDTVRINFDPKVVGARDLIERTFNTPLELAPIRRGSDPRRREQTRPARRLIEMDLLIVPQYQRSPISFRSFRSAIWLLEGRWPRASFFETSTLLVTLIMVGRFVSALARHEALKSISIRSLQETQATLVSIDGGVPEKDVDSRLLQYGDVFKLKPDSRAPTDGIVVSGSSEVDESMLTGESRPVEKHAGSLIAAGSMNSHGSLIVRLTRLPDENTISTIAGMVDDAKLTKPKLQSMANYVASRFVPVVVGLTVLVFAVWIGVGIREQNRTPAESAIRPLYAIAVLVVSCPCAIGLAVPMVIVIASGMAARRGIIFKSAAGIETVHKVTHIVFDKTGTLTEGVLSVAAEEYVRGGDHASTAAAILGLVGDIKHPVSVAMASHLRNRGIEPTVVCDVKSLTGRGWKDSWERNASKQAIPAGLASKQEDCVRETSARGLTTLCVTIDSRLVAVFGAIRLDPGDELQAVTAVAETIGIPPSMVKARCSPADKAKYIKDLISASSPVTHSGGNKAPTNNVIFVGDGTNDAPALAKATTGVHLPPSTSSAAARRRLVRGRRRAPPLLARGARRHA